jgi:hypothetical protein
VWHSRQHFVPVHCERARAPRVGRGRGPSRGTRDRSDASVLKSVNQTRSYDRLGVFLNDRTRKSVLTPATRSTGGSLGLDAFGRPWGEVWLSEVDLEPEILERQKMPGHAFERRVADITQSERLGLLFL